MILLYGADTAEKIKAEISGILSELKGSADISYEKGAVKKMASLSLKTKVFEFDENISSEDFIEEFKKINEDDEIDGILLFRPLPEHIDEKKVIEVLDERKDLDGISYKNIAKVFAGDESGFAPCTAKAVIKILESNNIELEGKNVVVLGRSMVIGKPVAMLAIQKNATVTLCHSKTADLKKVCKNADVLIVAIGRAKMINDDYIGEDAVVIDVGINFFEGKLCGDVDLENVKNAAMATPVPKGVGAVTTSVLAQHLVIAALKKRLY